MRRRRISALTAFLLSLSFGVLLFSGWKLFEILEGYIRAEREYASLAEEFLIKRVPGAGEGNVGSKGPDVKEKDVDPVIEEDANVVLLPGEGLDMRTERESELVPAPIEVDWDGLIARNPDIVGWIYLEGFGNCSYPVMHADDNETYLHAGFDRDYLYAGCIFLDYENTGDFSDPSSIVYGHNMKDGSMFACLKKLKDQETYDAAPYFWILTPNGNYRYHIYSVFDTLPTGPVYSLWNRGGENFADWERQIQSLSVVRNDVQLEESDHTVILSTCTPDHEHRTVVVGRRCI